MAKTRRVRRKRKKVKNQATILALTNALPSKEIANKFNVSVRYVEKLKSGEIEIGPESKVDKEMLVEMGFKICTCCGRRVVVERPTKHLVLTRLCLHCYRTADSGLLPGGSLHLRGSSFMKE